MLIDHRNSLHVSCRLHASIHSLRNGNKPSLVQVLVEVHSAKKFGVGGFEVRRRFVDEQRPAANGINVFAVCLDDVSFVDTCDLWVETKWVEPKWSTWFE